MAPEAGSMAGDGFFVCMYICCCTCLLGVDGTSRSKMEVLHIFPRHSHPCHQELRAGGGILHRRSLSLNTKKPPQNLRAVRTLTSSSKFSNTSLMSSKGASCVTYSLAAASLPWTPLTRSRPSTYLSSRGASTINSPAM